MKPTPAHPTNFGEKLKSVRKDLDMTQGQMAYRLGVSDNYVYMLETGRTTPSRKLLKRFDELDKELQEAARKTLHRFSPGSLMPLRETAGHLRAPVLSWAVAGRESHSELSSQVTEWFDTDCKDLNAYALIIEGDAMMPKFEAGDRVLVMPGATAMNGDVVAAKVAETGEYLFRVYHTVGLKQDTVRLTAYSHVYPALEYPKKAFQFLHPMYEMRRKATKL